MADRRRKNKRHLKRLRLRYGAEQTEKHAFTEDFSDEGIFIRTVNVAPPGSKILIELSTPDNAIIILEAHVIWGRRVPGNLIHLTKKAGMGTKIIRFIQGEAEYRKICS